MLKLPSLSLTLSAAFIWSVFSLPSLGSTQNDPICYMVTTSGQVMNLESMCQRGQQILADVNTQMLAKANACNGPVDQNGFPAVFSPEVQRLQAAIANAKQNGENGAVVRDKEVQSAITALRDQMPFASSWEQQRALREQMQTTTDPEERAKLREQMRASFSQLSSDQCYQRFVQALTTQLRPASQTPVPTAVESK